MVKLGRLLAALYAFASLSVARYCGPVQGVAMRKRGDRRRAVVQAAKEEAGDIVATSVALRVGQVIWYLGTYPIRLLVRGLDAL